LRKLLLTVLLSLRDAGRSPLCLADTYERGFLKRPIARIDISALASSARVWPGLIVSFEVCLHQSELPAAVGQLADRCQEACSQQLTRRHQYGVALCANAVEVFRFSMGPSRLTESSKMPAVTSVQRSGLQDLSIRPSSPGLQLLARVLLASKEALGYPFPSLKQPIMLNKAELWEPQLLADCREDGSDSAVYGVSLAAGTQAVLKLTHDVREVNSVYMLTVSTVVCHCIRTASVKHICLVMEEPCVHVLVPGFSI